MDFPQKLVFENYVEAFSLLKVDDVTFGGMIFNSVWYTALATFLNIMMPLICGYTLSKYQFKGRELIYTVAVTAMVIPVVGTGAANMRFLKIMNFYDNVLYVIWSFSSGLTSTFLVYYGFFKSVSWSYAEAAQVDGANHFLIFFKIMLPQALPIMMTYAITSSIGHWGDYQNVLLCLPSYPTLAAGLFEYKTIAERTGNYPQYFAGLVISMIPTLVLFASFSSKIMTSISIGGLKG